ncbi:hypothetical protein Clacol_005500 [Clathrus columnatus]|uniref:Uncharacterized protein n=1 Tax=Clathrus columnatus TaxID=1419009 RepID=A0AAV5ACS2_9AGAM|nr:hypothetical protein Clacol_005500 [Clathrus columnatus]
MPSAHSYTVMNSLKSIQNEDEDDICPVCESECTCKSNSISSQPTSVPTSSPIVPIVPAAPLLKIKLPPRALFQNPTALVSSQTLPSTNKRSRTKLPKQKQTIADVVTADGTTTTTSSNNYVLIHHPPAPLQNSSVDRYPGTGSPSTSANIQSTSHILRDSSPLTPEPELLESSITRPKQTPKKSKGARKKSTALSTKPSARRQSIKKNSAYNNSRSRTKNNNNNKDVTWLSPTSRRKGKQPISDDSDDYSDDETYIATMIINSDDGESLKFPTFVSAISSASDNDDVTTSIADSFDSDSSIRAEEEELIISEEQRAKVRYELFKNEESWHMDKRKWDHLKNSNNWEIRPRKRSVGPEDPGTVSDTESESEMEVDTAEDEEGEGDEDDDPDIEYGRGLVTGWQSSDDEDFDAELFFTTLTDSSGPGSDADAEDSGDETDHSDLSSISLREVVAAGLLSPLGVNCPFVVTEDWDGRLIFTNGLRDGQGVLDVHFEVSAAQRQRSIREAMEVDTEGPIPSVGNDQEDEEDDLISDDGDTTDDMLDQETPHVVPLPIRYPTPPIVSIDPLSTLSPIVGSKRPKFPVPVDSPKPADILAGAGKVLSELSSARPERSRSASVDTLSTPGISISSQQNRQPRMGSFITVTRDPQRSAIVDGTKALVFSPFSRSTRVGRGRERKRIMVGNDIPHPLKRTRQASLPSDSRTSTAAETDDPVVQSSPEFQLPASIGLDDVLDASFLDSDDSLSTSVTTFDAHLRNLTRWDRVPVSTFRRSRTANVGMLPVTAPPSDGVSYGSTGGHVLRRSPGSVPLWLRDKPPHNQTPGSVTVSPVIFPVRAGEKMTVVMEEFQDPSENPTVGNIGFAKSHKQKRKEKKKRAQMAKARAQAETAAVFTASAAFSDFSSLPAFVPPLSL